jgi:hypothetical protein
MLSIESLKVAVLMLLGGVAAGGQVPPETVAVSNWRGILNVDEERLVVNVTVMSTDSLALMVGSVKNADGENMAFLVPISGEGMVTSTWAVSSLAQNHPLTLWSDGNCLHLELRTGKEPEAIVERAPWLGRGIRPPDVTLLSVLQEDNRAGWPARELFSGIKEFHPEGMAEAEALGDGVWEFSKDPEAQPEALQERWDEIAFRYLETRDRLRRVEELRFVEPPQPPVESEGVIQ